jgi:quinol monooxygenase YgiN
MHVRWLMWLAVVLLLFPVPRAARAQVPNDAVYVVSYIDVSATAAIRAADILRQMAQSGRKAAGVITYNVLQRLAPQNQFVTIEIWKNLQARVKHQDDAQIERLRDELVPLLVAPVDQRQYAIVAATEHPAAPVDAIYALAHIDILGPNPAGRDAFLPVLKAFSDASRRAPGNQGYDVAEQTSRTNHFETVEVWTDEKSATDHEISALNREFRAKLGPASSSPYDRRLYKALR